MSSPFNLTITAQSMGTYKLRCIWIKHGIGVLARDSEGASRRVFYPAVTTSSGFGIQVAFPTYASRTKFSNWLRTYFERTVAGRGFRAPVRVDMPSRNFSRICLPEDGATYGEGINDIGYYVEINFTGSSDPLVIGPDHKASFFQMPKKNVKFAKNYYPGGIQLSGADLLETAIFDGWEVSGAHAVNADEYSSDDRREEVSNE